MEKKDWESEEDERHLLAFMEGLTSGTDILENELENYADYFEEHHAPEIAAILRIQFLNMCAAIQPLAWGIHDILLKNGFIEHMDYCGGYDTVKEAKEELEGYREEKEEK